MNLEPREEETPFPQIAQVPTGAALDWLKRGLTDMRRTALASSFYGAMFALAGWVLHFAFAHAPQYTPTLAMGFLLVGPLMAIGLYDLSRQIESGNTPRLLPSLVAWRSNTGGIGIFVLILTVLFLVWARASMVSFALFDTRGMPSWTGFLHQLTTFQHPEFLFAFFGIGLIFATIAFVFSAIAIPHLLEARADAVSAAAVSIVAVSRNPAAMVIWAASIVVLVGVGLVTAYVGLIFTGPLVGHATWHAYRQLCPREPNTAAAA
jgi:uncharacterized membrane protein